MKAASTLPTLHPPVRIRWSFDTKAGFVGLPPVTDRGGEVIVVAVHDELIGLAARTGERLWSHRETNTIMTLQACDVGPVITIAQEEDMKLAAFSWRGESLWDRSSGIAIGGDGLKGAGTHVIAIGVPSGRSRQQVCQVRNAATGEIETRFPCNGDVPDMVDGRFVYATPPGEGGGLFVYDPSSRKKRRVLDRGTTVRVVTDELAIVDTNDDDGVSRLIAVDIASGKIRWEDEGGRNFSLSVAGGQLASAITVDKDKLAMTLRDAATGRRLWAASSVKAEYIAPLLAADCVVGTIAGERIDIYDRADGQQVQSLQHKSNLVGGGCLASTGLIDVASGHVFCLSGEAS